MRDGKQIRVKRLLPEYAFGETGQQLMGALLVFGTLATVMFTTRRLDWYAVGEQMASRKRAQGDAEAVAMKTG